MTHDELLAKLSSTNRRYGGSQDNAALRAVVELHKMCCDLEELCLECNPNVPWPCPTIQAIEKELL